jgi:putative hydrolase of the HAD superfamily
MCSTPSSTSRCAGSYERLIAHCRIDPPETLLIEDTLRNLEPAHALGFTTALVGAVHPEPRPAYVDHWARDVKELLRLLTA